MKTLRDYTRSLDGRNVVVAGILKILMGGLAIAATSWFFPWVLAPSPVKAQRELQSLLETFVPRDQSKINYWLVIYQYRGNSSIRCRNVGIFPTGVNPLVDKCTYINRNARSQLLVAHKESKCMILRRKDIPESSAMMESWRSYGLQGIGTCPVYVNGQLWGYVGLSAPVFAPNAEQSVQFKDYKVLIRDKEWIDSVKTVSESVEKYFGQHPQYASVDLPVL